ncbi:hypothetical protein MHK_003968 [Candidatus Magnetomorum sp. HK-1]|nr:hypothetical protein MHK_003968 [Candidatus Magnetomorum sp. HK-1]
MFWITAGLIFLIIVIGTPLIISEMKKKQST